MLLGGDHDWAYILDRLDLMHRAEELSLAWSTLGALLLLAGIVMGFAAGLREDGAPRPIALPHDSSLPIRTARPPL